MRVRCLLSIVAVCGLLLTITACGHALAEDTISSVPDEQTTVSSDELTTEMTTMTEETTAPDTITAATKQTAKPKTTTAPTTNTTEAPRLGLNFQTPTLLSPEIRQQIEHDYLVMRGWENQVYDGSEITAQVSSYCGTYDGGFVIQFISNYEGITLDCYPIEIAGYTFWITSHPVWFYKDGTFAELADAYDQGLLSAQSIKDMLVKIDR